VQRHAPPDTEVVVVDDGSAHGCVSAVAAELGARIVRRGCAGGFAVAANAGVAATSGAIVELLNDDTEVTAGWPRPPWRASPMRASRPLRRWC